MKLDWTGQPNLPTQRVVSFSNMVMRHNNTELLSITALTTMILLLWSEAQQDEEMHLRLHTGWDSVGRATVLWSGWRLLFQWHDVQNVFFKSCRHRIFFTIFILKCNCTYGYHHKFHVSLSISHFSRMLPNLHCFLFFYLSLYFLLAFSLLLGAKDWQIPCTWKHIWQKTNVLVVLWIQRLQTKTYKNNGG